MILFVAFGGGLAYRSTDAILFPLPPMNFLGIGLPELILILLVLLLFFGKDKLPELARSIGKSVRELRAGFEKTTEGLTPKDAEVQGEGTSPSKQ